MDNHIWIKNSTMVQPRFKNQEYYPYSSSIDSGVRILFAGCSITANVGLPTSPDGGWSDLLVDRLKNEMDIASVNNCSISGGSTFEIISNIFRFFINYEKPNIIFLLLPPVQRESNSYAKDIEGCRAIDYNLFLILDSYCKENGIQLLASTWDFYIDGITSWFVDYNNKDEVNNLLKSFKSFFFVDKDKFSQDVFKASNEGLISLEGEDKHPSLPVHIGYSNMFYEELVARRK